MTAADVARALAMLRELGSDRVAYMAHPLGAPDEAGVQANIARATRWLRWLVLFTDLSIECSWIGYVQALDDAVPGHRARGLRDNMLAVERCDAIVLVGGRVSAGMAQEADRAARAGLQHRDLTFLGEEPPSLSMMFEVAMLDDIDVEPMLATARSFSDPGPWPRRRKEDA